MRGGQVTIFVILGIVLLAVVSFALFIRAVLFQDQLQQEAENLVADFLQANSINYYVLSCLERVTHDSLFRIAAQGGNIEVTGDLGYDYINFTLNDETRNVTYGIVPNTICDAVSPFQDAPLYPFPQTTDQPLGFLSDLTGPFYQTFCFHSRAQRSGFLGYQSLPGLCDPLGENSFDATEQLSLRCLPGDSSYPREETIQWQLQEYINQKLPLCTDFDVYEKQGHIVTLQEEEISSRIIYGFNSTTVLVTFPFSVNLGGNEPFIVSKEFSFTSHVRFRKVYEFLSELLAEDTQTYFFNKSLSYTTLESFDGFNVSFHENVCTQCALPPDGNGFGVGLYDDIVRVEDYKSLVDNKSFVFQTAIRNRLPALDYIHPRIPGLTFDVSVIQGETITLRPEGYDPDDTSVTYEYAGWKETTDSRFDSTCCEPVGEDLCPNFDECFQEVEETPHHWTTSDDFQLTFQDATYTTNETDGGEHEVVITITGEEGQQDFQAISVLVYDLPIAVIDFENGFAGLQNHIASIEDPYTLDASDSQASIIGGDAISSFRWRTDWDNSGFLTTVDIPDPIFIVPDSYWPTDILGIISEPFLAPGSLEVELTVVSGDFVSDPAIVALDIQQCIPLQIRNGNEITEFSYPYSLLDQFNYDHTCCQGTIDSDLGIIVGTNGGTPHDTTQSCYYFIDYGYPGITLGFAVPLSTSPNPALPASVTRTYLTRPGWDFEDFPIEEKNDVYVRDFDRFCDGTRGNICGGDITEIIDLAYVCSDFDSGEDERCSGPAPSLPTQTDPLGCYNYGSGQTFETVFNEETADGSTADGYCNNEEKCFISKTDHYKQEGTSPPASSPYKWSCVATCDGSGGCTLPSGCICSETCGAVCDDSTDYDYDANPTNPTCSYGCDLTSTCSYGNTDTCFSSCIGDSSGSNCPEHNPNDRETCYSSTTPCSASGCFLENAESLREDYCDICTPTGASDGSYCPDPGTIDGNICYYGVSYGCSGTICDLSTAFMPTCGVGQVSVCDPLSGPTCVVS